MYGMVGGQGVVGYGRTGTRLLLTPEIKTVLFLQQDPVSNTDKFPSAETSRLHSKGNVIEMIDETLLDQTGVHYNICQV